MAALDLSTARKDISQAKEGFGVISDDNPRFEIDLRKRNAILRNRNQILKKQRDLHFRRCKQYKLQLDQLQKKAHDDLQSNFATFQLLMKQQDEYHNKEISRLKEIISNREQESSQNLQVEEPFVNGEFTDLENADVKPTLRVKPTPRVKQDLINLKVIVPCYGPDDIVHFQVKKNTLFGKLLSEYCHLRGFRRDDVRFYFQGMRLNDEDTPAEVTFPQ